MRRVMAGMAMVMMAAAPAYAQAERLAGRSVGRVLSDPAAPVGRVLSDPPVHRLQVTIGGGAMSGARVGARDADLRGSAAPGAVSPLFRTTTGFGASPIVEARVGIALSHRITIEARGSFNRPVLRVSVAADAEGAPALTVVERVDQYMVGGGVLVMLDELRLGGMVPFAAAGAGYLRQLHEGLTLVEHGRSYDVGGGVIRPLVSRDRGIVRAAGLRADARLYLLVGGIGFDAGPRAHAAISGAAFVVF
jgi:hypothetical protein